MTPEFQLRPPSSKDTFQLADLGRETFVETFAHLYHPDDLRTFLKKNYDEEVIATELADPFIEHWVIEYQERLIAFIKTGPLQLPVASPLPNAIEIRQLYVRKEFAAQGLGKRLMTWAFEQFSAKKISNLYLSVFSENERAIRFYQNHGFRKCGEYDYPVGNQLDLEFIMHCQICPELR